MDPTVEGILRQCSLEAYNLPQTVSYYGYEDKLYTVNITNISYKFDYKNGKVTLTVDVYGIKTEDTRGEGYSSGCTINWKLYGPDGSVLKSKSFYSPSVSVGDSFVIRNQDVLSTSDYATAGRDRIEFVDSH
jgi:hypothetical protein